MSTENTNTPADFGEPDVEPTTIGGHLAELVWDGWIDRAIFDDHEVFPLAEIKSLGADQWILWSRAAGVDRPTEADIAEAISDLAHRRARSEWT